MSFIFICGESVTRTRKQMFLPHLMSHTRVSKKTSELNLWSVMIIPTPCSSFTSGACWGGWWQHSRFLRLPDESRWLHDRCSCFSWSATSLVQRPRWKGMSLLLLTFQMYNASISVIWDYPCYYDVFDIRFSVRALLHCDVLFTTQGSEITAFQLRWIKMSV